MSDLDKPAFPQGIPEHGSEPGLSKREYFTAMAMQGMLAFGTTASIPELSVQLADDLIKELEARR